MAEDNPGLLHALLGGQGNTVLGSARPPLQIDPTATGGGGPGKFVKADDGVRLNIAPKDMKVPEWGKGLTWGLTAYRYNKGTPSLMVRDGRLPPENQGSGTGVSMYLKALNIAFSEGRRFTSDGTVTDAGVRMWAALKRRGYDVQVADMKNRKFVPGPQEAPELSRFETLDGSPMFWVDPKGK